MKNLSQKIAIVFGAYVVVSVCLSNFVVGDWLWPTQWSPQEKFVWLLFSIFVYPLALFWNEKDNSHEN